MGDTYTGECKICGLETDLILGMCEECAEKKKKCRKHVWSDEFVKVIATPKFYPGAINYVFPYPMAVMICIKCSKIKKR